MKKTMLVLAATLALVATACGGGGDDVSDGGSTGGTTATVTAGDAATGQTLFDQTCATCHAPGGVGIEGLGKPMVGSKFVAGLSDAELLTFIKSGRSSSDPANTTGINMPPKGGNPSLNDQDLTNIIAYIRTIN